MVNAEVSALSALVLHLEDYFRFVASAPAPERKSEERKGRDRGGGGGMGVDVGEENGKERGRKKRPKRPIHGDVGRGNRGHEKGGKIDRLEGGGAADGELHPRSSGLIDSGTFARAESWGWFLLLAIEERLPKNAFQRFD